MAEKLTGKIEKVDKFSIYIEGIEYKFSKLENMEKHNSKSPIKEASKLGVGQQVQLEYAKSVKEGKTSRWINNCELLVSYKGSVQEDIETVANAGKASIIQPSEIKYTSEYFQHSSYSLEQSKNLAMQAITVRSNSDKGIGEDLFKHFDYLVLEFEKRDNKYYEALRKKNLTQEKKYTCETTHKDLDWFIEFVIDTFDRVGKLPLICPELKEELETIFQPIDTATPIEEMDCPYRWMFDNWEAVHEMYEKAFHSTESKYAARVRKCYAILKGVKKEELKKHIGEKILGKKDANIICLYMTLSHPATWEKVESYLDKLNDKIEN